MALSPLFFNKLVVDPLFDKDLSRTYFILLLWQASELAAECGRIFLQRSVSFSTLKDK
jgi:hypothetical protein